MLITNYVKFNWASIMYALLYIVVSPKGELQYMLDVCLIFLNMYHSFKFITKRINV